MKILFLQTKTNIVDLVGVMCLSTSLSQRGHEACLRFVGTQKETARALDDFKPDAVAFSAITGNHRWAIKTAEFVKSVSPSTTTLMGGPHPTYFPEAALEKAIDFAIRGEGEEPIQRFADALPDINPRLVPNLAWSEDGKLVQTEILPLVQDLDSLGMPDRDFYPRHYRYFAWNPVKAFFASRGCPFKCTYCFNHLFHELYSGKGQVVRFRSYDHIIEEILYTRSKYNLPMVYFEDDTLNLRKDWLFEFLEKYKSRVGLPFECNVRIDLMDRETAQALARAGCRLISFGLESGSEKLRFELLAKRITDEQILSGAAYLKEAGVLMQTTSMLGLPGETVEDGFKTMDLNMKAGIEAPIATIFQPFPRLSLTQKAVEMGVFDSTDTDKIGNSIRKSVLRSPNLRVLMNTQKLMYIAVHFPRLSPLIKRLVFLPENFIFGFLYKLTYLHAFWQQYNIPPLKFLRYAWFHRKHQS